MKLTNDQKVIMSTIMSIAPLGDVVRQWETKRVRHIVVDEILELLKKLKVTIRKDYVKRLRAIADLGKDEDTSSR